MTVSIDWSTYVISVPSGDLTHIQSVPTIIKEMDIDWFRLQLKDIEDSEEGMVFPNTHSHNTEVSLGGLTYARVVEILDPYTITFQDGQYAVNLVGANSNIGDKVNVNQVSVRSNNSAGMISSPEIQYSSFQNRVTIDVDNGRAGTVYPVGTPTDPVNNLSDALFIAEYRGFQELFLLSDIVIPSGYTISEYNIKSDNFAMVTVESGVIQVNTDYEKVSLYGEMGGFWNVLTDCWVYDITRFSGWMRGGSFSKIALSEYTAFGGDFGGLNYFDDLVAMYPGIPAEIIMNTDTQISMTDCSENVTIKSATSGCILNCTLTGGSLNIDSSCTGGDITITGVGDVTNNSTLDINIDGLVRGEENQYASYNNSITIDVINGTNSSIYPYGTTHSPCKTLLNISEITRDRGFKTVRVIGDLNFQYIPSGVLDTYTFIGDGHDSSTFTINDVWFSNCIFKNAKLTGTLTSGSYIEAFLCELDDLYNVSIDAYECTLEGVISLAQVHNSNFYSCVDGVPGSVSPTIVLNTCTDLGIWRYSGGVALSGIITPNTNISVNFSSGHLKVDASNTEGSIVVRGIGSLEGITGGTTINDTGLIDNASIWNNDVRTLTSAGAGGATAQEVWEYGTRSLNRAVSVSGIPAVNTVQVSGEYVRKEDLQGEAGSLTPAAIWSYASRTLTDQSAERIVAISGILNLMAPLLIGTVTGAGTAEEVYTYGGRTVKVYATEEGNVTNVTFS